MEPNVLITQLYVGYYNRAPDPEGLNYWIGRYKAGVSLADIANSFAASPEAISTYPYLAFPNVSTAETFLEQVYQNLFNRSIDADGRAYYANKLATGQTTPGQIIAEIQANANTNTNNTDGQVLANKVTVGLDFALEAASTPGFKYEGAAVNQANTILDSVTSTQASVDAALASNDAFFGEGGAGTPGDTFTLTTGIDAGAKFTGGTGNDTFIGDGNTASAADQVNGGAGTDTLRLFGNAAEPSHSGVEIVELTGNTAGFNVSDNADVQQLNLIDATTLQTYTIANGQDVGAATMVDGEVIDFAGNSVTALDLTVNGLGTQAGAGVTVDLNSTAQTSVNVIAEGKASNVVLANTGTKLATVSVAGDQAVTVNADTGNIGLTTFDASKATGNVTAVFDGAAKDITATGGIGNDTFNLGAALTQADKVNGGEGTDTLEITQASVTTVQGLATANKDTFNTNISGIEVLKVTDALTSNIDATRFDGINSFVLNAGVGAAAVAIQNAASGVTVELNDDASAATNVLSVEVKDATLAGNNSDVANLVLNSRDVTLGGAVTNYGDVNLVGVDTLNITSTKVATSTSTGNEVDIATTSSALDKVVVTGNLGLDLDGAALANTIQEIDASGMTVAATANGLSVAVAGGGTNGVKITGSGGVDTIVGSDAADIINGGAGNDSITGGLGNDVLTGGAGNDTFVLGTSGSTVSSTSFDTVTDYSNGTTVGTSDTLDFTGTAVVGAGPVAGWTINTGVLTKANATVDDFVTAVQANAAINEVYAFVSGSDTYVFSEGATAAATDDVLVKLVGVVGTSVVTTDTAAANEILIA